MSDKPIPAAYSGLYPRSPTLEHHHDALHKQAGQIVAHGNALIGQHQRIKGLEESHPDKRITELEKTLIVEVTRIRTAVWVFGVVWTIAISVAGLLLSLWAK